MPNKIILIPGAFQMVKNYAGYDGIDIWMGKCPDGPAMIANADIIITDSGGANYALSMPLRDNQKLIFVAPIYVKSKFFNLIIRDLRFLLTEGIPWRLIIAPKHWLYAFHEARRLLRLDIRETLKKIPNENVWIVRGKNDRFLCNRECADAVREDGLRLIEVDAGHIWNQNIANAVRNIISGHIKVEP